ncbi:MAG: DNA mismatch repair endonuclease MutL [Clostridiales bacterium]|nr:DNA mismatch repair endonuclease MutL [Clostridiales bacterium]
MNRINILPKSIFELIAAGEVVERPASVIKELIENSIDSGANKITVEIQNGGIRYMRVTDNGCGISRDDVKRAFTSHATSKISTADDLDRIFTLGFRGEALASICAVSRVEMLTKTKDEFSGTRYEISAGEEKTIEDAGCPDGTTIIVRDLFFNTPARMKFLKKDVSEGNFVSGIIDKIAVSHPEISFNFIRDGKQVLFTPGNGDLLTCCKAVFGKDFADNLVEVNSEINGIKINGFVSHPFSSRATRSMQNFFVNNRYIKNKTIYAALEEAYKGSIMVGKHPYCVLFLYLPYETVDVNVHPAKTEVRFSDEKRIFDSVYYSVKNAIEKDTVRPSLKVEKINPITLDKNYYEKSDEQLKIYQNIIEDLTDSKKTDISSPDKGIENTGDEINLINLDDYKENKTEPEQTVVITEEKKQLDYKVIGEAFNTYIIVEQGEKLLLIDKHAAHERMLYEELKKNSVNQGAQILINPVTVSLSKEEYTAITENIDLLAEIGFTAEDFGMGSVVIRECPVDLSVEDIRDFTVEIAGYLLKNKRNLVTEKQDWLLHNIACRAAVKGGNITSEYERNLFVKKLLDMPEIRYCPHGRPVIIELSKYNLEKQFGRIQ